MVDSHEYLEPRPIRPAIALLACFAIGIALDRFLDIHWTASLVAACSGLLIWLVLHLANMRQSAAMVLAAAIVFTGAFYHHGRWNWFAANELGAYCKTDSTRVCLRGRILGEAKPAAKPDEDLFSAMPASEQTSFRFAAEFIRAGTEWEPVEGVARLTIHESVGNLRFGDLVEIYGRLSPISKPTSPGRVDFQEYYRNRNQTCSIHCYSRESVVVREHSPRYSNASALSWLRSHLDQSLKQHVGSDQARFASAILLGNREQLPIDQREKFMTTGTAHLLAISGLHVGILASLFLFGYRFGLLTRRWALLLTIVFVCFYAWLVEFRPPVTRAAILLSLFCIGRLVGRRGNDYALLALAGFIVLLLNPGDLFQLGPQLSFLAFGTIVLFQGWIFPPLSDDPIDRLIRNSRPVHVRISQRFGRMCKQAILVSGLIWLVGLPLVARNFHLVTPVSPIINPIVLFPFAISLFSGLGVCFFAAWFPLAADFCGAVCGQSLEVVTGAIGVAESFSFGHWWTAGPTLVAVWVFYLAMFVLAVGAGKRLKVRLVAGVFCGWILFGWLLPFQLDKWSERGCANESVITFLDVGHGSSVLLQLPGGQTMLYDAGSLASSEYTTDTVSRMLWDAGIEHLDCIVVSHADLDHFNAVPDLVERFSVGSVYVSKPMNESRDESEVLPRLFEIIGKESVPIRELAWGDFVSLAGGSRIEVLSPPDVGTGSNDNSDSIVMLLDLGPWRVLLPGDLELNGMRILLGREPIDCDIAMLPHHGSKNSRPQEFVEWCRPEAVVVSAGRSKLDDEVVRAIQSQTSVLATAELGSIRFELSDEGQRVCQFQDGGWVTLQPR